MVWAYHLFKGDECDEEEEEPQQETETEPQTGESHGGTTAQDLSGRSSKSCRTTTPQKRAPIVK